MIEKFKKFIHFFIYPKIKLNESNNNLIICDVGSQGGLHPRWERIRNDVFSYEFDPQNNKEIKKKDKKVFNTALWSTEGQKVFNQYKNGYSSSFFKINTHEMDKFYNFDDHTLINQITIKTNTLDKLLNNEKSPDFLKLDVEGAELEILKGAGNQISKLLGIEIEIQFLERYLNTPLFNEIDKFLKDNNFELVFLTTNSWKYKNFSYDFNTNHRLVWGDAIYIKKINFEKLVDPLIIKKLVIILLVYDLHDYAYNLIDSLFSRKNLSSENFLILKKLISDNLQNKYLLFSKRLFISVLSLFLLPFIFIEKIKNYFFILNRDFGIIRLFNQ